ncbi:hypothetical protein PESP_a0788 [Pseudoalteromonas espejiana DSM 9414]|uniref:Aminoglycoside phosphotransferase domain-containing protein n=1 Tax=Pseudoalteromonas espejiana TaxID=28107 RepID=A0A510XY66_9GAMM|nr:phosphotransferase [Pseudoalteromonas espejiana]ASM48988.1 hypothetical protein PESP_a0788 [Pseudoalteromonas espejiana DSM 9414]GEK55985.1 hypothetical protein PES01_28300 [Pseudoalteromonas espejiana]
MSRNPTIAALCSEFVAPKQVLHTIKLFNGLSNDNYLIKTAKQNYLFKCYKAHWPHIGLQAQTMLSQYNVCPKPIWLDEAHRHAAFTYIDGDIATNTYSLDLINKLARVHSCGITTPPMDIAKEVMYYSNSDIYQQYNTLIEHALSTLSTMPVDSGFCHNDLVKDNIIVNAQGMYLIDFEYAQTNDVYFDLAALAISLELNAKEEHTLLDEYKAQRKAQSSFYCSVEKLCYFKVVFLMLCIGWYEQRAVKSKANTLRAQLKQLVNCIKY